MNVENPPKIQTASPEMLAAVELIQKLMQCVKKKGLRKLLVKHIDPSSRSPDLDQILDQIDWEYWRNTWKLSKVTQERDVYQKQIAFLIPEIEKAAQFWTVRTLNNERNRLYDLKLRIKLNNNLIHDKAATVMTYIRYVKSTQAKGADPTKYKSENTSVFVPIEELTALTRAEITGPVCEPANKDEYLPGDPSEENKFSPVEFSKEEIMAITGVETHAPAGELIDRFNRVLYMKKVREVDPDGYLCKLMAHPRGVDIVNEYAKTANSGFEYANDLLDKSLVAIDEMIKDFTTDREEVWTLEQSIRYGVPTAGLTPDQIRDLRDFSLAWLEHYQKKIHIDDVLCKALNAMIILDFLVPELALVSGLLGMAAGGLSLLREAEKDQRAKASAFMSQQWSEGASKLAIAMTAACLIAVAYTAPSAISKLTGGISKTVLASTPNIERGLLSTEKLSTRGIESGKLGQVERGLAEKPIALDIKPTVNPNAAGVAAEAGATESKALEIHRVANRTNPAGANPAGAPSPLTQETRVVNANPSPAIPRTESSAIVPKQSTAIIRRPSTAIVRQAESSSASRILEMAKSGLTSSQINALKRLLNKPISSMEPLGSLWKEACRNYHERIMEIQKLFEIGRSSKEMKEYARILFGEIRNTFWKKVWNEAKANPALGRRFEDAGIHLQRDGKSPFMQLTVPAGKIIKSNAKKEIVINATKAKSIKVTITLGHEQELNQFPMRAFSGRDLDLQFGGENSALLSPHTAMDPFLPDARLRWRLVDGKLTAANRATEFRGPTMVRSGSSVEEDVIVNDILKDVNPDDVEFDLISDETGL